MTKSSKRQVIKTREEYEALSADGKRAFLSRLLGTRGLIANQQEDQKRIERILCLLDPEASPTRKRTAMNKLYGSVKYTRHTLAQKPDKPPRLPYTKEDWVDQLVDFRDIVLEQLAKQKPKTRYQRKKIQVQPEELKRFTQRLKPLDPYNSKTIHEHLHTREIKEILVESSDIGIKHSRELTPERQARLQKFNRSWRRQLAPELKGAELENMLLKATNFNLSLEQREESLRQLFPNAKPLAEIEFKTKPPMSLEELQIRLIYSRAIDFEKFITTKKPGRKKQLYGSDTLGTLVGKELQAVKELGLPPTKDFTQSYATNVPGQKDYKRPFHTDPQKIAISDQRNLTSDERLIAKAFDTYIPPELKPKLKTNLSFNLPKYWPEQLENYKHSETTGVYHEPDDVLDLTNYEWNLESSAIVDCSNFLGDVKDSPDSQHIRKEGKRSPKGYKVIVVSTPKSYLPTYIDVLGGAVDDLTALKSVWQSAYFKYGEPAIWITDRGFAGKAKYGWCMHNRHYFVEVLKHSTTKNTYLEQLQQEHIANIKQGVNCNYSARFNLEVAVTEVEIDGEKLGWNVENNQLICDLSPEEISKLRNNPDIADKREFIDVNDGCIYRNRKYAPDNDADDWVTVYNLHPEKTKLYLVTCYRKSESAKITDVMTEKLNARIYNISKRLENLKAVHPTASDEELQNRLIELQDDEGLQLFEVDSKLIFVRDGELVVDYVAYRQELNPSGFSFFTNLHIPGLDLSDSYLMLLFAEVVYYLYRKRWTIELYFKTVKTGNNMSKLNVETAKTSGLKIFCLCLGAAIRESYNALLDGMRYRTPFKSGKTIVRAGEQLNAAVSMRAYATYHTTKGYVKTENVSRTLVAGYRGVTGYLLPTANSLNRMKEKAAMPLFDYTPTRTIDPQML